jgi:RPA family protein
MTEKSYKREIAYKVKASDLIGNNFVRNEGFESNHVVIHNQKISRVNIIGTVVDKKVTEKIITFNIDDGFANIMITFFDNISSHDKDFNVGDAVIVIGKVNDFNGIKINGEIIKKIDKDWLNTRRKELSLINENINEENKPEKTFVVKEKTNNTLMEQEIDFTSANDDKKIIKSPYQEIWEVIKLKDGGEGVDFDIIKDNTTYSDEKIEEIVQNLLKEGEIYEIKSGYYKVLE